MSLLDTSKWTYGAEHELGDWEQACLPKSMRMDRRDVTVMNSNGIAADPKGKSWTLGGEINTAPTQTISGQLEQLHEIMQMEGPSPTINHRSNLHLHIRVPGLREDLRALKQVAHFAWRVMPQVLSIIEPLPRPTPYPPDEMYTGAIITEGAMRRWRRRRVSHHTVLTPHRHTLRMAASSIDDFFRLHAPHQNNRPMHHLQPRECVNLRQLMETDTIEFRHFPGTLQPDLLENAFRWCQHFLQAALRDHEQDLLMTASIFGQIIPWPEYVHWREVRYRATCHDGTLTRAQIEHNITRILRGEFDEY